MPTHVVGIHLNMVVAFPPDPANPVDGPDPGGGGRADARPALPEGGDGLSAHPGHEAADARLRAQRFARGARRLDRREVPHLERLRRRRRAPLHEGRAAHQRHALLGDGDGERRRAGSTTR